MCGLLVTLCLLCPCLPGLSILGELYLTYLGVILDVQSFVSKITCAFDYYQVD